MEIISKFIYTFCLYRFNFCYDNNIISTYIIMLRL